MVQSIALVGYALFVNIEWFTKGMGGFLMAILLFFGQPIQKIRKLLNRIQNVLRTHTPKLYACCISNKKVVADQDLVKGVNFTSSNDAFANSMDKAGLFTSLAVWGVIAYVVMTYGGLIHDIVGVKEEEACVTIWGLSLLVELFWHESVKVMCMRFVISWFMNKVEAATTGDVGISRWYEENLPKNLMIAYKTRENYIKHHADLTGTLDATDAHNWLTTGLEGAAGHNVDEEEDMAGADIEIDIE
eukprot:CAMPEP_0197860684 /NCGR_PEP_ID=MMETSP1438-20131217/36211_1 /TAXON_ID=1461541 /ORGANISM="Pterosperma sp., Strain CCMP1384" /LENGTH=244 /DNA_ID=CAMNT_0043477631 /DNA_START=1 /DNA_END=735 /DNA_ORIENTATION=+